MSAFPTTTEDDTELNKLTNGCKINPTTLDYCICDIEEGYKIPLAGVTTGACEKVGLQPGWQFGTGVTSTTLAATNQD